MGSNNPASLLDAYVGVDIADATAFYPGMDRWRGKYLVRTHNVMCVSVEGYALMRAAVQPVTTPPSRRGMLAFQSTTTPQPIRNGTWTDTPGPAPMFAQGRRQIATNALHR
jgi:hypothetical protein